MSQTPIHDLGTGDIPASATRTRRVEFFTGTLELEKRLDRAVDGERPSARVTAVAAPARPRRCGADRRLTPGPHPGITDSWVPRRRNDEPCRHCGQRASRSGTCSRWTVAVPSPPCFGFKDPDPEGTGSRSRSSAEFRRRDESTGVKTRAGRLRPPTFARPRRLMAKVGGAPKPRTLSSVKADSSAAGCGVIPSIEVHRADVLAIGSATIASAHPEGVEGGCRTVYPADAAPR